MYEISKEFEFEASHLLTKVPEGHKCGRPPSHGHSYRVIIYLQSDELNEQGFVVDFGELKPFKDYLDNNFDHMFLNDIVNFETTAENLAVHFRNIVMQLIINKNADLRRGVWVSRVDVWETRKSRGSWINE